MRSTFPVGGGRSPLALGLLDAMRNRLISAGCWAAAVFITIGIWIAVSIWPLLGLPVFLSPWVVARDARIIGFQRYECGISRAPPAILVLLVFFGWPIIFPWYLAMRFKIMAGTARLRWEYDPARTHPIGESPRGLVQPWRGHRVN